MVVEHEKVRVRSFSFTSIYYKMLTRIIQVSTHTFLLLISSRNNTWDCNKSLHFLFPFSLQQGHREDLLSDTFWLMAFLGSASFIGSQVLANWLIGDNVKKRMTSPSMAAVFLALAGVICVARLWRESSQTDVFEDHGRSYFSDGKSWISPLLNSTSLLSYEKYPLFIEADISTWIHGWLIKGLK